MQKISVTDAEQAMFNYSEESAFFGYRNNLRMKPQRSAITFSFQEVTSSKFYVLYLPSLKGQLGTKLRVDTAYVSSTSPISLFFPYKV